MAPIPVRFEYLTGLRRPGFTAARLTGGWDAQGRPADAWSEASMEAFTAEDGCPAFRATAMLDDAFVGRTFRWGVRVDTADRASLWAVPTEVNDPQDTRRHREFVLRAGGQTERYHLTDCRRFGANKLYLDNQPDPAMRFTVWAPNASEVALVLGEREGGYIYNNGTTFGGRPLPDPIPLHSGGDGIWMTDVADNPSLADFRNFRHQPYMYRITREGESSPVYRTDLFSRCQIGSGGVNPDAQGAQWSGRRQDLDGGKSCSVVVDPERVVVPFRELDAQGNPIWPETQWQTEEEFWANEFDPQRPLPTRRENMVIYELHVDGLGRDRNAQRGTLDDAMRLIPYLRDLGINAVGLMPMSEFQGGWGWGYSTTHYCAVEYGDGGRDQFKHFVRECHRNGIAVILDVVYNHYAHEAERAQWEFDSGVPEHNVYYWYEGRSANYSYPTAGYVNNGSSGWAPRYWEERVRRLFLSSVSALVSEFHFDGFRVDLTQAIHRDNSLNVAAPAPAVPNANLFGQKLLREWSNTIRLLRPNTVLIAEDHSGWDAVYRPTDAGGLGFDAIWWAEFYHHLMGDAQDNPTRARLVREAGYGDDRALAMTWFAGILAASSNPYVVYNESHDEAGNAPGSARTIALAVNYAPLTGLTRTYAEARVHVAAALTLLAPTTPMFFMGEEVGASLPYTYQGFLDAREDYHALRAGAGAQLFAFYAALVHLRRDHAAMRARTYETLFTHDADRLLVFHRWSDDEDLIVVASLNNRSFPDGYIMRSDRFAAGQWREILNSDATAYGGGGLSNAGTIASAAGVLTVNIPANSVLVLQRQ
jgi:1,4-alpha-glucan branching enzyme